MSTETCNRLDSTLDVFEAILAAARVLTLSKKELQALMTTLCLMAREETVRPEHVRGPLAASIPGALQGAAKAMGVSTPLLLQRLKTGTVRTEQFLPTFAKALHEATASIQRLIDNSHAGETCQEHRMRDIDPFDRLADDAQQKGQEAPRQAPAGHEGPAEPMPAVLTPEDQLEQRFNDARREAVMHAEMAVAFLHTLRKYMTLNEALYLTAQIWRSV